MKDLKEKIIEELKALEGQDEDIRFVLGKMRAKLGDVAIDDMLEAYGNFIIKLLSLQKQEIVEEIIKTIKNPEGLQVYSTGTINNLEIFIRDKDLISYLNNILTKDNWFDAMKKETMENLDKLKIRK